jgi:RNA polymerase sigma-70 factor (sigma-E family)
MADLDGFAAFVAARSPALARTAYLLTRDHALAEDLLQTALARCWLVWSRIHGDPEPYVRRTLVNTYTTWWRRRWNGETPTADPPEGATGTDLAESISDRDQLWQALGRLPKRQRAVIVLRFYEDLTVEDTANLLGCSTGTVKSQTRKALARLRLDESLLNDGYGIEGAPA